MVELQALSRVGVFKGGTWAIPKPCIYAQDHVQFSAADARGGYPPIVPTEICYLLSWNRGYQNAYGITVGMYEPCCRSLIAMNIVNSIPRCAPKEYLGNRKSYGPGIKTRT